MESRRKSGIVQGLAALGGLTILWVIPIALGTLPKDSFWTGSIYGIALGILSCFYVRRVWDPIEMKPIPPHKPVSSNWLMPLIVIGSILSARLMSAWVSEEFEAALNGVMGAAIYTFFGYLIFIVWWHRPKSKTNDDVLS